MKEDKQIKVKTYVARGLLDFRMAVNVAGAIMRIAFTGGSMGSNGVMSARFTTSNEAVQRIIERSPQFRTNKIQILYESVIPKKDEND